MKFKTQRIANEYESNSLSDKLVRLIKVADSYMLAKYNYEITVTDLIRTQDEQDEIYKDNEKYKSNPWKSVHQYGRGADLRTRDMSQDMIDDLEQVLNRIPYDTNRPDKKTCLVHNVGKGMHFHIQSVG